VIRPDSAAGSAAAPGDAQLPGGPPQQGRVAGGVSRRGQQQHAGRGRQLVELLQHGGGGPARRGVGQPEAAGELRGRHAAQLRQHAYDDSALDTGGGLRPDLAGHGLGREAIRSVGSFRALAGGRNYEILVKSSEPFRVTVGNSG
jgi:hypothetical protein